MLAELAVGYPGQAWLISLEGKRINKYWLAGLKLDVIGAGILERHVILQRSAGNGECQNCRILQLAKRPFIWI